MVPTFTASVTLLEAVPLSGLKVSHEALSVALQLSVPVPLLVIVNVLLLGLTPAVVLKAKLVELRAMLGPVVEMTRLTGTVTGVAPVAVIVIKAG